MRTLRIQETRQFSIGKQNNRHLELDATTFEGMSVATKFNVRIFENDNRTDTISFTNLRDALASFDVIAGATARLAEKYAVEAYISNSEGIHPEFSTTIDDLR